MSQQTLSKARSSLIALFILIVIEVMLCRRRQILCEMSTSSTWHRIYDLELKLAYVAFRVNIVFFMCVYGLNSLYIL